MSDDQDKAQGAPVPTWSGGVPVPAHPRQHPDFEPGNELAVKHGAGSPRKLDPIARELVDDLLRDESVTYLRARRFASAVAAWATAEAKCQLLATWVEGMALVDATDSGQGRTSPLELLRRWEETAQSRRSKLGLDPSSAARLGKDVAQGRAADAAAELTLMREQHERAVREGADDE
jgi:hypothetical protein